MQDNSQETIINKPKPKKSMLGWYIAAAVLVCGILMCLAYFAGASQNAGTKSPAAQTPAATTPQATPPSTPAVTPPASTPAVQQPAPVTIPTPAVTTPAVTPVVTPPAQTPSQPSIPPSSSSVSFDTLITKQAYQLVLTLTDMGTGWMQSSAASPSRTGVASSSHVNFTKGSSFSPVVQNMVSVYRTINAAQNAYEAEVPANTSTVTVSHPSIGDECFLNDSVANNKVLVFRKNNVVVWVLLQQDKTADPLPYARTVEQRITQ